jgi:hypothetical protein
MLIFVGAESATATPTIPPATPGPGIHVQSLSIDREAQFQRHFMSCNVFYIEKDLDTPCSLPKPTTRTLCRQAKRRSPHSSGQSSTTMLTGPRNDSSMHCRSSAVYLRVPIKVYWFARRIIGGAATPVTAQALSGIRGKHQPVICDSDAYYRISTPETHILDSPATVQKHNMAPHRARKTRSRSIPPRGNCEKTICTIPTSTPIVLNANSRDISASRHSGSKPHSRHLEPGSGDRTSWIRQPSFLSFCQ